MFMPPDEDGVHNWQPLSPDEVYRLFYSLAIPWWIAGGWAIDLFVGHQTRLHGDIDVLILRKDQLEVQHYLSEWDLHKTQQPGLKPWPKGEFLKPGVNDVWCRRTPGSAWSLQLMLMETKDDAWYFRRDPTISGPIDSLGRLADSGIPYVAPEIQLLFKSNSLTIDKNKVDFETTRPLLSQEAKRWLLRCLEQVFPHGHEWILPLKH